MMITIILVITIGDNYCDDTDHTDSIFRIVVLKIDNVNIFVKVRMTMIIIKL